MKNLNRTDRRAFLKTVGAAVSATGLLASTGQVAGGAAAKPSGKRLKKAVKLGMVKTELPLAGKFKLLKELGFDGVEMSAPNDFKREEVLEARDQAQLPIHGVVDSAHWRDQFSDPDPAVRARGLEALKTALRDAKAYGATSVLVVPGRVTKTVSYDEVYTRSQTEIRKAIPLARDLDLDILIENVWNNFLLSPLEAVRYIDELNVGLSSPVVGAYFDVGNIVRIGWPEHWIRILGPRIVKLDIKEYSREKQNNEGLWKGFKVKLLEGDCDWPAVMKALREINYRGWATAEIPGGDRPRLTEIAQRMDRIFAS